MCMQGSQQIPDVGITSGTVPFGPQFSELEVDCFMFGRTVTSTMFLKDPSHQALYLYYSLLPALTVQILYVNQIIESSYQLFRSGFSYYPHLSDVETEAVRGSVIWPLSCVQCRSQVEAHRVWLLTIMLHCLLANLYTQVLEQLKY